VTVIAAVAVRLKSKRLPRKAIRPLYGQPLILRLTERISAASSVDKIVWCTSVDPEDDRLELLAAESGIEIFRGHRLDVLSRFISVMEMFQGTHLVRVTGDNPLTDPVNIDWLVTNHIKKDSDYTCCDALPRGTKAEVFSRSILRRLGKDVNDRNATEYLTIMARALKNTSINLEDAYHQVIARSDIRLTVDTKEDFNVVQSIYEHFLGKPPKLPDLVRWLDKNPDVVRLNHGVEPTNIPTHLDLSVG